MDKRRRFKIKLIEKLNKKIAGFIKRKLSAGCGVAWECDLELRADIEKLLKQENIEFEEIAELSA